MLTKSDFVLGTKCVKALFLKKRKYSQRVTEQDLALREQGYEVEGMAKEILFPNSVPVNFIMQDIAAMDTFVLMEQGHQIYQGVFIHQDKKVVVDFLTPMADGSWCITEVKSSTSLKNEYLDDLSYQLKVLTECDVEVSKIQLCLINTDCIWPDKANLFKLMDVTAVTQGFLERANEQSIKFIDITMSEEMPDIQCGKHCVKPNICSFSEHCFGSDERLTIWDIPRLNDKREQSLLQDGIRYLDQINLSNWATVSLTDTMREYVSTFMNKTEKFDKLAILAELSSWKFPLVFFDFETDSTAVPKYDGTSPYQQIPFQYSMYVLFENGDLVRRHFLHIENTDPRSFLVTSLVRDIEEFGYGNLVAYYDSFEKTVMKKLALEFPEYATSLLTAADHLRDLFKVVKANVTHHAFKGSYSIKKVSPVLLPGVSYDNLSVQNGIQAQLNWRSMLQLPDGPVRRKAESDQIEYCDLDSKVMVDLYHELFRICA